MLPQINFIGCGKVGKTFGKLLHTNKLAQINGVVNTSIETALAAVDFIGEGAAFPSIQELPPADIYFITTTDDAIEITANHLAQENILKAGNIVLHCSGSHSSEILQAAKKRGCHALSIHPNKSFASPEESVNSFSGTYCAIEGDEPALSAISTLFEKMGATLIPINKENKSLYHTASVFANNYLVTLHYQAVQSYTDSGVDEVTAKKMVNMLMTETLKNIDNLSREKALTGPIQRGDTQTVKNHLFALKSKALVKRIYSCLGLATLSLTKHSTQKKQEFEKLFTED